MPSKVIKLDGRADRGAALLAAAARFPRRAAACDARFPLCAFAPPGPEAAVAAADDDASAAPPPGAFAFGFAPKCPVDADTLSESAPPFGFADGFRDRERELVGDGGGGARIASVDPPPKARAAAAAAAAAAFRAAAALAAAAAAPVIGFCLFGRGSPPALGVDGARARLFEAAGPGVAPRALPDCV
jgi:hypothetical protein